jgi:hypothetical protein
MRHYKSHSVLKPLYLAELDVSKKSSLSSWTCFSFPPVLKAVRIADLAGRDILKRASNEQRRSIQDDSFNLRIKLNQNKFQDLL